MKSKKKKRTKTRNHRGVLLYCAEHYCTLPVFVPWRSCLLPPPPLRSIYREVSLYAPEGNMVEILWKNN